jgi:predicted ester cyclase
LQKQKFTSRGVAVSTEENKAITCFPDLRVIVEDMIAEGDKVAARITLHATQTVPIDWLNDVGVISPTGRQFDFRETQFWRIANGRIVERWVLFDTFDWLQQLGAFTRLPQVKG